MYTVVLDEGASCMGGDERTTNGSYATYLEALKHCCQLIDAELARLAPQAKDSSSLFELFQLSGIEPFVDPPDDPPFNPLTYAREQCFKIKGSAG